MEDVTINIVDLTEQVDLDIVDLSEEVVLEIIDAGVRKQMRQEYVAPHLYIGKAAKGEPESDPVWKIFKLLLNVDGSVVVTSAVLVKWTERLTVIYI